MGMLLTYEGLTADFTFMQIQHLGGKQIKKTRVQEMNKPPRASNLLTGGNTLGRATGLQSWCATLTGLCQLMEGHIQRGKLPLASSFKVGCAPNINLYHWVVKELAKGPVLLCCPLWQFTPPYVTIFLFSSFQSAYAAWYHGAWKKYYLGKLVLVFENQLWMDRRFLFLFFIVIKRMLQKLPSKSLSSSAASGFTMFTVVTTIPALSPHSLPRGKLTATKQPFPQHPTPQSW